MLKWLVIGVLSAGFRLFIESPALAALADVREAIVFLTRERANRARRRARTSADLLFDGGVAGLIIVFWPLYIFLIIQKVLAVSIAPRTGHGAAAADGPSTNA